MHETCFIIIHDPGMRPGPESNRGPLDFEDECSTSKLTLLLELRPRPSPVHIAAQTACDHVLLVHAGPAAHTACGTSQVY